MKHMAQIESFEEKDKEPMRKSLLEWYDKQPLFIRVLVPAIVIILGLIPFMLRPQTIHNHAATITSPLAIRVLNNHLVNNQGKIVQLVGVNVSGGGDCIPIGNQPLGVLYPLTQASASQTAAAIASWHANVVRVTLNEDCWLGINGVNSAYSGASYQNVVTNFITLLHSYGIYAIVDLHTNAPGSYVANSQQVMADSDHATMYWKSVATTFKNDSAVIFEAYNEPHITTSNAQTTNPWDCWLNGCTILETDQNQNQPLSGAASWQSLGMQGIVNAIRSTGATNPIMLGGLNWSEDLTQFLQYLPQDPQNQLVAAYHNYMSTTSRNSPTYWNNVILPITQKMPVVTSEMGENDCLDTDVTPYLQWADANDVSYIPWMWSTLPCSAYGLLSDWNGTPNSYGQIYFNNFAEVTTNSSQNQQISPTLVMTPTDTIMPTALPSPTPVVANNLTPTITITCPTANGASSNCAYTNGIVPRHQTIIVSSSPSSSNGIAKVVINISDGTACSISHAPYSCLWAVPGKPNVSYTIQATAYDSAGNASAPTKLTVLAR